MCTCQVCKCLRFSGITIPLAYEAAFQRAIWTFNHQRVFCPQRRALVHLRPVPEGGLGAAGVAVPEALPNAGESDLAFLGPPIDDSTAQLIADGARCTRVLSTLMLPETLSTLAATWIPQCSVHMSTVIRYSGIHILLRFTIWVTFSGLSCAQQPV